MNSNHSTYTAPLLRWLCRSALLTASLLVLGACHSSLVPTQEEIDATCPRTVRIMAAVEGYAGTHSGTRAVVNNTSTGSDTFEELSKEAKGGEKAIRDIFLFVVPELSPEASQVIYYYSAEDATNGISNDKISGSDVPAKLFTTNSEGEAVMELNLKPGRYTFITVANSVALRKTAIEKGSLTLSSLRSLTCSNRTFVARTDQTEIYVGKGSERKDFPIYGQQVITVPSGVTTTETLSPVIDMERVFARVDLTLTTIDKKGGDYLKTYVNKLNKKTLRRPSDYRLTSMKLLASTATPETKYRYPILPLDGEYSAVSGYRNIRFSSPTIDKSTAITSTGWEDGSNTSESYYWQKYVNNGADGELGKLWRQPLFYSSVYKDQEDKAFHLYLPPIYLGDKTKEDNSVRLELKFKKLDDSNEILTYLIPIHNEEGHSSKFPSKDYYSIRRNTIYHIDLTFYGDVLYAYKSGIKVLPWKIESETIEVDEDEATTPSVIP